MAPTQNRARRYPEWDGLSRGPAKKVHRESIMQVTDARSETLWNATSHLIRKFSLVSFVPFISSRIQTGSIPLPDHLRLGFFFTSA